MGEKRIIGIVGGIAPSSTVYYYEKLVALYRERFPDRGYPRILIDSLDLTQMVGLVERESKLELVDYLLQELYRLSIGGAALAAFASNTPHIVFDEVARRSPVPLLSIVEATRDRVSASGARRVGLFGTRFTMESGVYRDVLEPAGVEVVLPREDERTWIHTRYMGELVEGNFRDETRQGLLQITQRMVREEGIEALVLGGTELPLLLRQQEASGVPLLDTGRIHVEAIWDRLGD